MSGIIGPLTTGRLAFALGTVGVGALIGGAVASHKDGDVAKGALIGGASAVAGLALLYGGAHVFNRITAARAGVGAGAAGASQLASKLSHLATAPSPAAASSIAAASAAATSAVVGGGAATAAASPAATSGWRTWIATLFREAPAVTTLQPLTTTVPAIARTPALPVATTAVATSGDTFLTALQRFVTR